ncbi:MAG TPA: SGNH/GDSL hydrolase family protein [Longimicrobiales bacterium]|nr:SGNH/GDSL hydrolase family protein [Longimicrobiales bacterium]
MNRRIALPLLTAALALTLGGCIEDETIVVPEQTEEQQIFQRYVALGNSLTAGYMSGGINDSTQRLAYPVVLAQRAGASFSIPSLAMPGCPPPLVGVLDTDETGATILERDRVSGGTSSSCALRSQPAPEVVQNVAVPGARMADAFDIDRPGSATNPLTTLLLGGMSQVEAMRRAQPTLVTSWLGNNDVLAGALRGDPALMTPLDTFAVYEARVAGGIGGARPLGVVLIGVVDVTLAPVLQPGLYYWVADSLGFAPKPVSADCAPTDATGARNPLSMNTVSFLAYGDPEVTVVSCDPAAPYVLTREEADSVAERVDAFNSILRQQAMSRSWMYLSSTQVLDQALLGSEGRNRLRRCEFLDNTLTLEAMVFLVETQCPHPSAPNFFGSFVTFDGIHMSDEAHRFLAGALADVIEARFDLTL